MSRSDLLPGSSASYRDCFVSCLMESLQLLVCTNFETITLTSILNLPRTKSDMVSIYCQCVTLGLVHACAMMSVLVIPVQCTCCNDEAVTGSVVHGKDWKFT